MENEKFQRGLRQASSVLLIAAFCASIGYVIATGLVQYRYGWPEPRLDFIAKNYMALYSADGRTWTDINLIIGLCFCLGLLLAARIVSERLTRFGVTHWMAAKELARKNFFGDARTGFVLAKTSGPKGKGKYIVSGKHPHCLVVAPTGRGKGVGFVIPNLFTYKGSAAVLDVKSENFEATSRFRQSMGQKVYRFAPRDFDQPSHRWNPLARIKDYTNPAKRMAELERIATLFLQADDSSAASFLPNAREVFIACAILAYEQGDLTMGRIYKLAYGGGDNAEKFTRYAAEVKDRSAKILFEKLAGTTERTLSAYLSVLSSAGMNAWMNPHTCAVTDVSDFDFSTFRKSPQTVYLTVPFNEIPAIAPLIRLFFSDLIASLQDHLPTKDEPFPVLILMDEFQRIGKVPIVAESISLLRGYKGNLAIITQTIPDLDAVYGDTVRKTLQGGAGIKLYLTPSEPDTIAELSEAVGMTTKRIVSKSRSIKDGVFGTNLSERTEDHPLLTKDQARRLPDDEVVIVVDADMPIRAKRIEYYHDTAYQPLYESQDFNAPLPTPEHTITEADYRYIDTADDLAAGADNIATEADAARERAAAVAEQERAAGVSNKAGQGQLNFSAVSGPEDATGQQAFNLAEPKTGRYTEAAGREKRALPVPAKAGSKTVKAGPGGVAKVNNSINALAALLPDTAGPKRARFDAARDKNAAKQGQLPLPETQATTDAAGGTEKRAAVANSLSAVAAAIGREPAAHGI